MHASDLQILTRLTLGQVMRTYAMCECVIMIRNCIHGSIRVLNMWILMLYNCTVRVRACGPSSHVILRHICGHFTGSYPPAPPCTVLVSGHRWLTIALSQLTHQL